MKYLISHNDLDGLGPVILALHLKLDFNKIIVMHNINEIFDFHFFNDDEIIITDLSLTKEQIKELNCKVIIFDHHTVNNAEGFIDKNRCATKIFCEEYLKNNNYNNFINVIDKYDRYIEDDRLFPFGYNMNILLQNFTVGKHIDPFVVIYDDERISNVYDPFINKMLNYLSKGDFKGFVKLDKIIIKNFKESRDKLYNEKVLKSLIIRKDSNDIEFGIINGYFDPTEFGIKTLKNNPNMKYILCYKTNINNGKLSVRSVVDFNILEYSKGLFKGHPNAAGCYMLPENVDLLIDGDIKDIFELKKNEDYQ